MFGLFAALNSFRLQSSSRDTLNYENSIAVKRTYRESSIDRKARKEAAEIRYKEQLQQQVKLVRLMKKLLIKIANETPKGNSDKHWQQRHDKVVELELKVEKAARAKHINCEDMFDLNTPDDAYDIQLEQIVRDATLKTTTMQDLHLETTEQHSNTANRQSKTTNQSCGDDLRIESSYRCYQDLYNRGDGIRTEHTPTKESKS